MAEPSRKRGRTARACDECRLRKSKCDGLQPCEACQTTDRYCTYNLSAGRSTGSGTRIRILEDRLRRARAYLHEAQKRTPSLANVNFDALLGPTEDVLRSDSRSFSQDADDVEGQGELESMMDAYGQLDLNSRGCEERDFYGAASGLAWIEKTRHYFDDDDSSTASASSGQPDTETAAAIQLFDAPLPPKQVLSAESYIPRLLPPRQVVTHLVQVVFTQVYPMFHFLCEEDFHVSTDKIYNHFPTNYEECDQAFLPLFYLVMALGYLFSKEQHREHGCRASVGEAMRYFIAARNMMDIAHLRTMVSLQAIISLILYLVSTARMASAHAFLGAACAAAMRQGLHFRSTHESDLPSKEKKVRRRVFWAVVNLDMYITSILGLPPFMDISTVDPAIDTTIGAALEESKGPDGIPTADGMALMAAAKHIELSRIIFKAQRTLYPKPLDPPEAVLKNSKISVSVQGLQVVETQFRQWAESLKQIMEHPDKSVETQAVKYEMHICYYFAQIVLYRAFLHYLAKPPEELSEGRRELVYANTCVTMAKKVIEISIEHQRRGLLCPASWPSVYTVFISVVCLVFAYATRKEQTEDEQLRRDVESGIRLLACTACTTDTGSVRCLEILRRLIKRVSYAVDIDFVSLCARITPCWTTEFIPRAQEENPANLNVLHIAATSGSGVARGSSASVGSSGQHWSLSPNATMTQPTFTAFGHASQSSDQQSFHSDVDQMLDVSQGSVFNWQEENPDTSRVGVAPSATDQQAAQLPGPSFTPGGTRLTAEDIAAFMHSNPLDHPYSRGSR